MATNAISHYEILARIGEGGMGVVYRAVDTRLGRAVAVKLLRPDGAIAGERRKRFMQEARAASALNHPNIITIYDIGRERDVDFIAMEYVAGTSLAQLIGRGRLDVDQCLKLAVQIADALAAAHAAGIFHRDLKPANIMVTESGSIKVLDFGLAKLAEAEPESADGRIATQTALSLSPQTDEGTILGTAAYMSPEQAEGKPADARSDIFSFGAVLYEMVTGQRAFGGATKVAMLAAVMTRDPEPLTRLVPGLLPDLEKIIGRCLRKNPERRWQSMSDLKVALEDVREEIQLRRTGGLVESGAARRRSRVVGVALMATVGAAAILGAWWVNSRLRVGELPKPFLTRLTSDVGWTDYPAISRDGRLLAYASDRSGEGNLDIWVQHVPDGAPVRLTRNAGDDVDPSFSSDGSSIAFQSNRQGSGIYLVPTLGGEERLLVAGGFSPRFSPDGRWLAYGIAEQGSSHIYVSPVAGGPATPIASGFYRTQAPVWSPDGRHLLFWGQRQREAAAEGNVDWYVTAVPGGPPSATEARRVLLRERFEAFQGLPLPDAWGNGNDRVLFHATVGDSSNMWQVPVSVTRWRISGAPERVTFGTTDEAQASVSSDGKMVFISRTRGADLWNLPIDASRGKVQGPLQRLTQDAADDYDPSIPDDGTIVVYRSRRAGRFAVVMRKMGSSAETVLARAPADHYAAINREGTKVAYAFAQNGKMPVFVVGVGGGTAERVCDDCGEVKDWLPGSDRIVYVTQTDPSSIGLLKIGGRANNEWVSHRSHAIFSPRVSSDGRWVAFNSRTDRLAPARVFIARIQEPAVAGEKDWIEVSKDGDAPSWSPEGTLLYFWSDRDGSPCLWAQRLDPATRRPLGSLLSIQHFHSRGLSWKNLFLGAPAIAVTHDRVVFNLGEHTGNVWMTELPSNRD